MGPRTDPGSESTHPESGTERLRFYTHPSSLDETRRMERKEGLEVLRDPSPVSTLGQREVRGKGRVESEEIPNSRDDSSME